MYVSFFKTILFFYNKTFSCLSVIIFMRNFIKFRVDLRIFYWRRANHWIILLNLILRLIKFTRWKSFIIYFITSNRVIKIFNFKSTFENTFLILWIFSKILRFYYWTWRLVDVFIKKALNLYLYLKNCFIIWIPLITFKQTNWSSHSLD